MITVIHLRKNLFLILLKAVLTMIYQKYSDSNIIYLGQKSKIKMWLSEHWFSMKSKTEKNKQTNKTLILTGPIIVACQWNTRKGRGKTKQKLNYSQNTQPFLKLIIKKKTSLLTVISNWTCRTLCWRVTGQITKFLNQDRRR